MKVHASNRQQNYDDWRWNGNDSLIDQLKEYLQEIGGSFDDKTKNDLIRSLKHLAFPTNQNDSLGWSADTVKEIANSWATRYDVRQEQFEKIWEEQVRLVEFDCFLKKCKDKNYLTYHQNSIEELPKIPSEYQKDKKLLPLHEMMHIFSQKQDIKLQRYQKSFFYNKTNKGVLSTKDLWENCKILKHYMSYVYDSPNYTQINEFLSNNFPMLKKERAKYAKQFDGSKTSKAVYEINDLEEFFEQCRKLYEVKEEVLPNKPIMDTLSNWNGIKTYSSLEEIENSSEWTAGSAIGVPSELIKTDAAPGDVVLVINNGDQINLSLLFKKIGLIEKSLNEIKEEIGKIYVE